MNRRLVEPSVLRTCALFFVCFMSAACLLGRHAAQISVTENQPLASSRDDQTFARLMLLLSSIPSRWSSLGPPRIPLSGRAPAVIVNTAPDEDRRKALDLIED